MLSSNANAVLVKSVSKLRNAWSGLGSLQQRLITAIILALLFLLIAFIGGAVFTTFVVVIAMAGYHEWLKLVQTKWPKLLEYTAYATLATACFLAYETNVTLAVLPLVFGCLAVAVIAHLYLDWGLREAPPWICAGLFYIGLPAIALIWLRDAGSWFTPDRSWLPLLMAMMAVWMTDTFAYFSGRRFGGPKVAPKISPNKTWSGVIGGMVGAGLTLGLLACGFGLKNRGLYLPVGAALAAIAQIGDFFESYLKRRAGVKDSGTIIPGHGGLLDRIDGVLTAAPCFAVFLWLLR